MNRNLVKLREPYANTIIPDDRDLYRCTGMPWSHEN